MSLNNILNGDIIDDLLLKFNRKEISNETLAKYMEISISNINMFSSDWIYLAPSFITEKIGYKANSFRDFIKKYYEKDVDYKKCGRNHELVKSWWSEYSDSKLLKWIYAYCLVTHKCFKSFLMRAEGEISKKTYYQYAKIMELNEIMSEYNNVRIRNVETTFLDDTLVKFKYKKIISKELAKIAGFNDVELNAMDVFYKFIYNKKQKWFYAYPDFIKYELRYIDINKFYMLLKNTYKENVDYLQVDKNHKLIKKFWNGYNPLLYNAVYYLISEEHLKLMLMKKNPNFFFAYEKIEKLVRFKKVYNIALKNHKSENKCDDGQEQTSKTEDENLVSEFSEQRQEVQRNQQQKTEVSEQQQSEPTAVLSKTEVSEQIQAEPTEVLSKPQKSEQLEIQHMERDPEIKIPQDNRIEEALVEFDHKMITNEQVAKFMGFNEKELEMMNAFCPFLEQCSENSNKEWFYLYPEFITGNLGYSTTRNFYKDVLIKHYIKNKDYQKVNKNHELVKKFYQKNSKGETSPLEKQLGNRASYYIITGKTLKLIMMRANTDLFDIYTKVEKLVEIKREYDLALKKHHEKQQMIKSIPEDNTIDRALVEFDHEIISNEQIAKFMGFNEQELKMMNIFWKPCFNKEWIPLPREMIKEWFCANDTSEAAVRHFYDRVLFKYEENYDYRERKSCRPNLVGKITNDWGGSNAKNYEVTGECFKMIGMNRNKEIRRYYIKVEKLAIFMKDYIQALQTYTLKLEKKIYEQKLQKQLEEKDNKILQGEILIKELTVHKAVFNNAVKITKKREELYITTTRLYAKEYKYKIGMTINKSTKRISSLNTANIKEDKLYICHVEKCYNARLTEYTVHKLLDKFKHDGEWFQFPYELIKKLVIHVSASTSTNIDFMNSLIDEYNIMAEFI